MSEKVERLKVDTERIAQRLAEAFTRSTPDSGGIDLYDTQVDTEHCLRVAGLLIKEFKKMGYHPVEEAKLEVLGVDEILAKSRDKGLCPIVDTMGIKICQAISQATIDKQGKLYRIKEG